MSKKTHTNTGYFFSEISHNKQGSSRQVPRKYGRGEKSDITPHMEGSNEDNHRKIRKSIPPIITFIKLNLAG
jgi:hypothetical protein